MPGTSHVSEIVPASSSSALNGARSTPGRAGGAPSAVRQPRNAPSLPSPRRSPGVADASRRPRSQLAANRPASTSPGARCAPANHAGSLCARWPNQRSRGAAGSTAVNTGDRPSTMSRRDIFGEPVRVPPSSATPAKLLHVQSRHRLRSVSETLASAPSSRLRHGPMRSPLDATSESPAPPVRFSPGHSTPQWSILGLRSSPAPAGADGRTRQGAASTVAATSDPKGAAHARLREPGRHRVRLPHACRLRVGEVVGLRRERSAPGAPRIMSLRVAYMAILRRLGFALRMQPGYKPFQPGDGTWVPQRSGCRAGGIGGG